MNSLEAQLSNVAKLPIKQRNIGIDSVFYDTTSLDADEQDKLNPLVDREGSIVVVSPRAERQPIRHYKTALRFMIKEGNSIQGLAVAGVGSSVLGTAALARNVADSYGFDVAGLVTGYGIADLITEALGGWFFYGYADRFRHSLEWVSETLLTSPRRAVSQQIATATKMKAMSARVDAGALPSFDFEVPPPPSADLQTLRDLLIATPASLKVIVGHSKGCLLTSFALNHFVDDMEGDPHPFYETLTIVTLGAVVSIPRQFRRRRQFLGQLDWFGGMNSRLDMPHHTVPNAWHHLNTQIPFAMSVREVLARVRDLAAPDLLRPPGSEVFGAVTVRPTDAEVRTTTHAQPDRRWGWRRWDSRDVL